MSKNFTEWSLLYFAYTIFSGFNSRTYPREVKDWPIIATDTVLSTLFSPHISSNNSMTGTKFESANVSLRRRTSFLLRIAFSETYPYKWIVAIIIETCDLLQLQHCTWSLARSCMQTYIDLYKAKQSLHSSNVLESQYLV